ncbi:MAG: folate family ECF transporter S component, partial [Clostridia bacterium]|nr:folate family ECF transporter S component [Clostridia bacterium]
FGPLVCCMTGMVQDILSYLLNPVGGYIPTYTLCVGISGMIYGLLLYRKPIAFWRVLVAKTLVLVFSNILLNSIALAPTVGSGFVGILPARIIKNLLLLPIQTVVAYLVLKFVKRSRQIQVFEE